MLPVYTSNNKTDNVKALQIFPNPISVGENLNIRDLPDGKKLISVFNNLRQRIFFEKTLSNEYSIQSGN